MDTPAGTERPPREAPPAATSLRLAQWRRRPDHDAASGDPAGNVTGSRASDPGGNGTGRPAGDVGGDITGRPAGGRATASLAGAPGDPGGNGTGGNLTGGPAGGGVTGAGPGRERGGRRRAVVVVAPVALVAVVSAVTVAAATAGGGSSPKAGPAAGSDRPTFPMSLMAGAGPFTLGTVAPSTTGSPSPSASAPRRPITAPPRQSATGSASVPAGTGGSVPSHRTVPAPAAGDGLAGHWLLAENTGGTTADDTLRAHPGTSSNVQWKAAFGIGYGWFDGVNSQINTAGPVLNTGRGSGFTVAAWVYMSDAGAFHTAVSQDGSTNSGFYLQYSHADDRWAFARVTSDSNGAPGIRALSSAPPVLNSWVHLAGVFDPNGDQLRLYVNGALQGVATDDTPFAANGSLAIGRALFNGVRTDWFPGAIRDVQVFSRALTARQVGSL